MAKPLTGPDGKPTGGELGQNIYNTAERKAFVQEAHAKLLSLEEELAGQRAKVKAVNQRILKERRGLKAKLDITLEDFDHIRQLIMLDEDERKARLDTQKELFQAFDVGVQLSWLDAFDGASGAEPPAEGKAKGNGNSRARAKPAARTAPPAPLAPEDAAAPGEPDEAFH